ncbi:hypothetical protein BH09BAC3_BH09BAC3_07950 [soil metagenome]
MRNGGVKIKIRRELLSPESIYKHQNYSTVLKRHERHKRFRRALKLFIYSLFAAVLVLLLVFGALFLYKQIQAKNAKPIKTEEVRH